MHPKIPKEIRDKLRTYLEKVQTEEETEIYIFGITDRQKRTVAQQIDDFMIEQSTVPQAEKSYFFSLLSTMLGSGISLNQALKLLISKSSHPRLKRIIATMSYEIEHGRQLSQSMERFNDVFSTAERGAIRSAEATGNLETVLNSTSKAIDRSISLMMKLKSALVYPVAVFLTLIVGFSIMLIWVVPKIEEVFSGAHLSLPATTRFLIFVSHSILSGWWIMLTALFILISFALLQTNSPEGRFSWDFMKLRMPIAGKIFRKLFVLRFVDNLGMLIESGVSITAALELTAEAIGNDIYRVKTYDALAQVTEGVPLSQSLMDAPFLFPATVSNMLAVAEQSASIGDIAKKIASHYEREIAFSLKTITTTLGPLLIIITGIGVGLFALAVLAPVFSLTQSI